MTKAFGAVQQTEILQCSLVLFGMIFYGQLFHFISKFKMMSLEIIAFIDEQQAAYILDQLHLAGTKSITLLFWGQFCKCHGVVSTL